jgi:hypothetical protein
LPTLQPQNVSGLVVIPTVESDPGIHRVSIAINVGQSRTPPAQVVSREDLVVELRNPTEGSFEPIASPDPGPLPVRALRVVQARAEFTFAQGNTAPTELVVSLRGDRKTFPMSQTLTPTKCLGKAPQKGDPFPGARKAIRGFSKILLLRRPQCCVKDFDAPQNSATDATVKSEYFEIDADFAVRGRRCSCRCCEYRQFVRGTFTDVNGAPVRFDLPSGALSPTDFCEDGSIDEFGAGSHGYYGHRATSSTGDEYGGAGTAKGCTYNGREAAGCPPTETVELEYLGVLVDVCRGRIVDTRKWSVQL